MGQIPPELWWKFENTNRIHVDSIFIKMASIPQENLENWSIIIDDKQFDCKFDQDREFCLKGRVLRRSHLTFRRVIEMSNLTFDSCSSLQAVVFV